MKALKNFGFYILAMICIVGSAFPQTQPAQTGSGIRLESFVDMTEVPFNRTVKYTIRLQWFGNLDSYDIHHFDNPIVENFEIVGNASANKVSNENNQAVAIQEYEYTLKPKSLGMGYVEGIVIMYTDLATSVDYKLATKRIEVKVTDPVPEPGSKIWMLYVLGIVVALGLACAVFVILQKRKAEKRKKEHEAAAAAVPIEEQYLQTLKNEVKLDDPDLNLDNSYTFLTRLLRRFLKEKFNIPGLESTTTELVPILEGLDIDSRFINEIKDILAHADMVKFSGSTIDRSEVERTYTLIEAILQKCLRGEIKTS